tara:strand:+ start:67 stop:579 length:513 start_codon:yes stop_codon:yes gene_type:complete
MFDTFNDGKSFNIGCASAIYQHQANMLTELLVKKLDKKYMRMIESLEPAPYNEGFTINLKDHLITTKDQKRMVELQEAVWDAGVELFNKLEDLGDEEFGYDTFEPASSSADDVEKAVKRYIKAHEEVGYSWDYKQVEQKFDCYNDENDNIINQRVQDYKPVCLFTKEETA